MISVFYDKDNLYTGHKDLVISDFTEYVFAYINIMEAIHSGNNITVITTNKQIFKQIQSLHTFYPRDFKQKQYSIREEFEEKYEIHIPEYITDSDLLEDKTYLQADFGAGESFENAVLRNGFGTFFVGKKFPFQLLAELCASLSLEEVKNKKRVILRKVFQKRIREYVENSSGNYEKFIIEEFMQNFDSLKSDVALYLVVKNYPIEFREDMLGRDVCKCMDYFRVEGPFIDLEDTIEISYKDRANVFLNTDKVNFEDSLSYVSGKYAFELSMILTKKQDFSKNDIDEIMERFRILFENNPQEKNRVTAMKAPVVLQAPGNSFEISDWMEWALDNYLPYKFWMETTGKYDEKVDDYAAMFGDWIFEKYDTLINSYPEMIYKILPSLKDDFLSNEHSLFIILDNFNFKFVPDIQKYLSDEGFNQIDCKPVLAMIPTETAISKRAFFTGEAYNNNYQNYEDLVKNWSRKIGIGMKYLPNVGALRELHSFDEKVIFMNYLRIDEMLHENLAGSAQSIEMRICQELEALVGVIVMTLKKLGREKDTDIYFIADHGSTKILPVQKNEIEPKYYKEKAEDSDYRFISVNDEDFENTKSAIGSLCYALDKARYNTNSNYFIARKYNRFIKNEMKGYVHGGITPEESIVPFMHFAFDVVQCKNPEITLGNDLLRFAVSTKLNILVKNFNEFDLDEVTLGIQNNNVKYEKPLPVKVDGYGTHMIEIPNVRITKVLEKKNNEQMIMKVTYMANGRKHSYIETLALPMKSVQSSSSDLSDLF